MKTIFAVAVLSCLIAIFGLAQSQDCLRRETEVSGCISRLGTGGGDFCNTCANTLIRFYQDCAGGVGVDQVKQCKSIMHALHVLYINLLALYLLGPNACEKKYAMHAQ